jgi:hypothetical protein
VRTFHETSHFRYLSFHRQPGRIDKTAISMMWLSAISRFLIESDLSVLPRSVRDTIRPLSAALEERSLRPLAREKVNNNFF